MNERTQTLTGQGARRRGRKAARAGIFRWAIFLRVSIISEVITRSLPLPDPRRAAASSSHGIAVGKNYWSISGSVLPLLLRPFLFFSFVPRSPPFRFELRAKGYPELSTRLHRTRLRGGKKRCWNSLHSSSRPLSLAPPSHQPQPSEPVH